MKSEPQTSTEFQQFDALVSRVLSVSHEEIQRREAEYRKRSAQNPKRRGPKPKFPKSSAPQK